MKKNLKKVISSLVALTLSLSSVAAFAATGLSDVPETESYASAVNELVALKIVNGYEDGTFKPDAKVSRAEVTKMVVAALNQTRTAESSATATPYTDVPADHWAAGFINVGSSANGFINGMGDGTFNPDGNVTYSQLVKMLVASCGYNMMAMQNGGYPTGYMSIASQYGMLKGVSGIGADEELTRAQVAVLLDNAIKMPILDTVIWSLTNPEYAIQDGQGDGYKTLLTEKHNAYVVEGRVTTTNKTTGGSLDADKVTFRVESADNFDGVYYDKRDADLADNGPDVYIGDTDADKYLQVYSSAIIQKNDEDDFVILSITPSGRSTETVRTIGAFDDEHKDYNGDAGTWLDVNDSTHNILYFYETDAKKGSSKSYKLDTDNGVQFYVNGVHMDWNKDNIDQYLVNNTSGDVTLLDVPQVGASYTDGKYDCVFVTYYLSGMVNTVSGSTNKIAFNQMMSGLKTIELDDEKVEDGDLTYHITMDGQEIKATDIQEDDVLAVSFDVQAGIEDSSFYDIIVTRGTVEGMVSTLEGDQGYAVGDAHYKPMQDFAGADDTQLEVGTTYTLWIDAFNRIVDYEEAASTKKIAILDNIYTSTDGETVYVKVVLGDNTQATYELKDDGDAAYVASIIGNGTYKKDASGNIVINDDAHYKPDDLKADTSFWNGSKFDGSKAPISFRVVEYKLNSKNEFSVSNLPTAYEMDGSFKESTSKIGNRTVNSDAKIIDASDYSTDLSDLDTLSLSSFVNDNDYKAIAYDKASDNSYRFVVVTDGVSNYTDDTQIAVFNKELVKTDANGDSVKAVEVYYNGELATYEVSDDICSATGDLSAEVGATLTVGDVLLLKVNGDKQLTTIDVVYDNNLDEGYDAFVGYSKKKDDGTIERVEGVFDYLKDGTMMSLFEIPNEWKPNDTESDAEVAFGPIVDKTGKNVTLAKINDEGQSAAGNNKDYGIGSDTKVYVFDYNKSGYNRLYVGGLGDILRSTGFNSKADGVDWNDPDVSANYAFIKSVDGDATEILVVLADN